VSKITTSKQFNTTISNLGHFSIKEYHFHVYFRQNYEAEVNAALELKDKVVAEVIAGNMTVVCDGVTSDILPGLDDSKVPGFHTVPYGPHAVGNFKVFYNSYLMTSFTKKLDRFKNEIS